MTQKFNFDKKSLGWWTPDGAFPATGINAVQKSVARVKYPVYILNQDGQIAAAQEGTVSIGNKNFSKSEGYPLYAYVPPLSPEDLGDSDFKNLLNLRYAYIAGAMANGITSTAMVKEMGRSGMIGFFGAAGLKTDEIEEAINKLQQGAENFPFGFNLIHSPNDPDLELETVRLYLKHGIKFVSASAFMGITLPVVYFRVKGIHIDNNGEIVCPNTIIAKVSRIEVARRFFSPPPERILAELVDAAMITEKEAFLARSIPLAQVLTAEADSGGHTDNRPAISLLPVMLALRNEMAEKYQYKMTLCVGLGGGIATPASTAAAFAMGAAYVLTGSINQSCVEAGTSESVRLMLSETTQADVTMAPAADMFELGAKVQVLKRGTMFPLRASKLYDLYCKYDTFEDIPENQKKTVEKDFLRCSFKEEWIQTKKFFGVYDPKQITRANQESRHKMALVFRSYLGRSSTWAIAGQPDRKIDYQIWCGPAMGAFNHWAKGSFLEKPENRKVVTVAMNLMFGAAVLTRINWLGCQKIVLPAVIGHYSPMKLSKILELTETQEN